MDDADRHRYWSVIALAAVLAAATVVRLQGIAFGLPYVEHPDEPVNYNVVIGMLRSGGYNPEFFNYPSLPFYAGLVVAKLAALFGAITGHIDSADGIRPVELLAMGVGRIPDPGLFLTLRLLTAIVGVATIWVVYRCGVEMAPDSRTGRLIGLIAAAMAAISPTLVANSRYITPDAWGTLFIAASVLAALRVYDSGEPRHYLYAGVLAGLAAGSKYAGGLAVLALPLAHALRIHRHGVRSWRSFAPPPHLTLALVLSLLVFLLTTPFAVLDLEAFLGGFLTEVLHYSSGHAGMEGDTLAFYGRLLLHTEGAGAVLGVAGLAYGIARQPRVTLVLAVFPVIYFAMIADLPVRNARTFMPVLPFLFLMAASLLVSLGGAWLAHAPNAVRTPVTVVVAAGVLAAPTLNTVREIGMLTGSGAAAEARDWIAANVHPGARVVIESYAPYIDPDRFAVHGVFALGAPGDGSPAMEGADYLVASSRMYGRFVNSPDRYPEVAARYGRIFGGYELYKYFSDGRTEIRIYRTGDRPPG